MTDKPLIPDAALDRLWRTARSFDDYTAEPVTDTDLRALYDLDDIEKNHEAYAGGQRVVASSAVRRLLRGASAELVPVAG